MKSELTIFLRHACTLLLISFLHWGVKLEVAVNEWANARPPEPTRVTLLKPQDRGILCLRGRWERGWRWQLNSEWRVTGMESNILDPHHPITTMEHEWRINATPSPSLNFGSFIWLEVIGTSSWGWRVPTCMPCFCLCLNTDFKINNWMCIFVCVRAHKSWWRLLKPWNKQTSASFWTWKVREYLGLAFASLIWLFEREDGLKSFSHCLWIR